jgi:hypothetical protein
MLHMLWVQFLDGEKKRRMRVLLAQKVRPNEKRTNEEYNSNITIRKKKVRRVRSSCSHALDSLSVWLVDEWCCHNFSVFFFFLLFSSYIACLLLELHTLIHTFLFFFIHLFINPTYFNLSLLPSNTRDAWKRSSPNVNYFISCNMTVVCGQFYFRFKFYNWISFF